MPVPSATFFVGLRTRLRTEFHGATVMSVLHLRNAVRADRMGPHVAAVIAAALAEAGISHLPRAIPQHQDSEVLLYLDDPHHSLGFLIAQVRDLMDPPKGPHNSVGQARWTLERLNAGLAGDGR
ncbi:hypothetical protein LO771_27855 [Streptacidiphilus sp. ASG 303]|uniref:hypothetical protein n=1 Tax=Streptacidiphilus sp. ASG 303 TaxID=2896847 RepID=UPI001E3CC65B|nr:hypothetical protein [Streptacidiphilus sp. ASG 303]MCD0486093.1 hypothetical protein [Streptacidiphilus sp. ASG 303]